MYSSCTWRIDQSYTYEAHEAEEAVNVDIDDVVVETQVAFFCYVHFVGDVDS